MGMDRGRLWVRCLRRVKGQCDYRQSKKQRNAALYPDSIARRRYLAVTGRRGILGVLRTITDERSDVIANIMDKWPKEAKDDVKFVSSDAPSSPMDAEFRYASPI